jgi:hypothetical protein
MLEQLRMQEVSQIILSKPEGAVIRQNRINPQEKGVEYGDFEVGEPVMIINNPALSNLSFVSKPVVANDAQGHIGTAGITNQIDFVINEGSILYALWSYIYGLNDENIGRTKIRGNEYLSADAQGYLKLSAKPEMSPGNDSIYLYRIEDNENVLLSNEDYEFCVSDTEPKQWYVHVFDAIEGENYFIAYNYMVDALTVSTIKQIHNNVFCSMDIYIDAVDLKNDDKHTVYIHCDKVQVDTDMILSINDSSKASFTPIRIKSVAQGEELNKDIAKVVVI